MADTQQQPLPEGMSEKDFQDAVREFQEAIGKTWVYTEEKDLRAYRDAYSPLPDRTFWPSVVLAPDGIEDIQNILAIANRYHFPLWTISTGKNFAYGGPAPRLAGFAVLDLKRMNRILEVNEKHAYCLVEPGVSYMQLYRYLKEKNIKLWLDPAAPAWGGLVGNTLDHGAGYTPYGDHLMMQCGMEVVLADGTVVRTGQGALPTSKSWQIFKYAFGPVVDGLFTQSNFGVVTKLGMWLMPEPPGYKPFMMTFAREEDLHEITEIMRPLKVNMIIPNGTLISHLIWEGAAQVTKKQYHSGKGPLPPSALKKMAQDLDLGIWNVYGALYGPPPIMENTWKVIEGAFSSITNKKIYFERQNDPAWDYRKKLMQGIPNMTEFGLMNWVGGGGHINFSPISPPYGKDAVRQFEMIRNRCHEYGFDYIGEFLIGWRDMHHILMLMFDRTDEKEAKKAYELFGVLIDDAAKEGYGEYRTHLAFMDQIAKTYNFNDHALWKLHHKIKDALDPNGILSPGKMGIWPRQYREKGHG